MSKRKSTRTILLDPFPSMGHVNAFLRLADFLKRRGFRCVFIGPAQYASKVLADGHGYQVVDPFVIKQEASRRKERGWALYFFENWTSLRRRVLNKELELSERSYDRVLGHIEPELILLDDQYSSKALFYSRYGLPIIRLFTKVNPFQSPDVPPFQSSYVPDGSRLSYSRVAFLWWKTRLRRSLVGLRDQITTGGLTNMAFLQQAFANAAFTLQRDRCFAVGINELPMVILRPRAFDFPREPRHDLYHFYESPPPAPPLGDQRLLDIVNRSSEKLLVYCSLGTVAAELTSSRHSFFRKVLQAARQLPSMQFILSLGVDCDPNKLGQVPRNVTLFKRVPQNQLLPHVDLMMTHGGMNSVMECIQSTTPMLVYPLSLKWDQPGNGARVAYHQMGLTRPLRSTTPKRMVHDLRAMEDQLPRLMEHISRFRKTLVNQAREDRLQFMKLLSQQLYQAANEIYERRAE